MTQHVHQTSRRHRKSVWALAVALAAVVATAVIPLGGASGRPTTYTFTGDAAVCPGTVTTPFSVTLTNTTKSSQNLGSADLYAPANIEVTAATITSGTGGPPEISSRQLNGEQRSLIHLRDLQLPGGGTSSLTLEVTANVIDQTIQKKHWYSIAKQANNFNPGDLDLSNAFQPNSAGDPYFEVAACSLSFVQQPPISWQKNTTVTPPVEVAVYVGTQRVAAGGTPQLEASGAGDSDDFSFGVASYSSTTLSWTWPSAKPKSDAPSGFYNLTATLGAMTATSDSNASVGGNQPFYVATAVCEPEDTCDVTSDLPGSQILLGITNTLSGPIAIDFSDGSEAKCDPWDRASYFDQNLNEVFFPGFVLEYAWGEKMLQAIYRIRNSEWVLTDVARGNKDIEICAGAKHGVDTHQNDFAPSQGGEGVPFKGKYGDAAWHPEDGLFWGVLATVSNPNKVKNDPAVCGRGTEDRPTGPNGTLETWRTWTICIPYDWDWKGFG